MFKIFLSSKFKNVDDIIKPSLGLCRINFIQQDLITTDPLDLYMPGQFKYGCPALIDVSKIPHHTHSGRVNIDRILQLFHAATGYGCQVGTTRLWPSSTKKIGPEEVQHAVSMLFEQDKRGKPELYKSIQFTVCWAHPFTTVWADWTAGIQRALSSARHKLLPAYAELAVAYHPSCTMRGKIVNLDQLIWMLREVHAAGYDGAIINSPYDVALPSDCWEAFINMLNQINE